MKNPFKQHLSLKNRFRLYLFAIALGLSSLGAVMLSTIYLMGLDEASDAYLQLIADDFYQQHKHNNQLTFRDLPEIEGYLSTTNIPKKYVEHFSLTELTPNKAAWATWFEDKVQMISYALLKPLDNNQDLYLFRIINTSERREPQFSNIKILQWSFIAFALLMVIILSSLLINQVINPVTKLSRWLETIDKDQAPSPLPNMRQDEIGFVAQKLYAALMQTHDFHQREKQFLQNASHELRTPIAVVSSALELIKKKQSKGDHNIDKPIQRIQRASQNMKSVTESLLWLARDNMHNIEQEHFELYPLIKQITENNHYLFPSQRGIIDINGEQTIMLKQAKALFSICIENLVRNAIIHASTTQISIYFDDKTITVSNHASANINLNQDDIIKRGATSGLGFGIGLSLVAKIAEMQGWQFTINNEQALVNAVLRFDDTEVS